MGFLDATVPNWLLFGLELANVIMLLLVHRWIRTVGTGIVNQIAGKLGLRTGYKGKNPSIMETLKAIGGSTAPEAPQGNGQLPPQLAALAEQYLGTSDPDQVTAALQGLAGNAAPQIKTPDFQKKIAKGDYLGILGDLMQAENALKGANGGQAPSAQAQTRDRW